MSSPQQMSTALSAQGVRVEPADELDLMRAAALLEISAQHPGPSKSVDGSGSTLSLGDALILAVSEKMGAKVLTGDRYWGWMVDQGLLTLEVHSIPG